MIHSVMPLLGNCIKNDVQKLIANEIHGFFELRQVQDLLDVDVKQQLLLEAEFSVNWLRKILLPVTLDMFHSLGRNDFAKTLLDSFSHDVDGQMVSQQMTYDIQTGQ